MKWNDSEVNRALALAHLSRSHDSWGAAQARVEMRAFAAKDVQETLCSFVAHTHVDIPRTRLNHHIYAQALVHCGPFCFHADRRSEC